MDIRLSEQALEPVAAASRTLAVAAGAALVAMALGSAPAADPRPFLFLEALALVTSGAFSLSRWARSRAADARARAVEA
jgi:hypothetical protein